MTALMESRPERAPTRSSSGLAVGFVAASCTAVLDGWLMNLQAHGRSAAALNMPDMGMTDIAKFWAFPLLQASGLVGLAFAYLSVVLGLQQSGRAVRLLGLDARRIHRLHEQVSWAVVALVLVHVVATVYDAMGNTWSTVLVPGKVAEQGWPAAEWGFTSGIIALYLLILLAPSVRVRRFIGVRRWRLMHRFVLVFYVLSVWHALILGLDVAYYGWIRPALWLAQIPVLLLFIRRLGAPRRGAIRGDRRVGAARAVSIAVLTGLAGAAVVAIVLVVVTGHSDLVRTV